MKLPIRLAAQEKLDTRVFARSQDEIETAWMHIACEFGTVRFKLTDGGATPLGEQSLASPGLLSTTVMANKLNPIICELVAGDAGFQGVLSIEPLKS